MKEKNVVEYDTQVEEVVEEPKKKFFTKDRFKKIGIIVAGAAVAAIAIFIGVSASSNGELENGSEDSDDLNTDDNIEELSNTEENEETLEETEA